jgi:predicted permease
MVIGPGYFETMRIPLITGREFTDADHADAPKAAIVNETFRKRYWPNDPDPVGRRIQIGGEKAPWVTVVGLARDVRHSDINEPPRAEVYRPHRQMAARIMMLVARGRGGTQAATGAVRHAVWQVDREQPLFRLQSLDAMLYSRSSGERSTARVLGIMAAIALILAAVGTYGVMAYTAAQRVREIGIRLALGATPRHVFRMVLRAGLSLAVIGLLIGLPAAYSVTPLLRALDSGVNARDGVSFAGVAALLLAVALCASAIPAWRAMRVDPASVLRDE